jgi:hypothetical protein
MFGKCYLCLEESELQFSHLLPKALYRMVGRGSDVTHPDTVEISLNERKKSSVQSRRHILCARCEQSLNANGEKWVLHNCYRGRGVFRLREGLRKRNLLSPGLDSEVYSTSEEESSKLGYFSISVAWRASLCDWPTRSGKYHSIDLGPYQEQIRRYLRGEADLPNCVAVTVILSQLDTPVLAFCFPLSYKAIGCHCYRFHIPGMSFVVAVGRGVLRDWPEICILRSPVRPVFVSKSGDERTQEEMMKLMGKVAPPWAKYPLMDGVEKTR